ncbi:MAG TPA: PQQ-binding-like beta-propeller repeat protein [Candidatus Sumerlaeota bacterium]|nr:PQQ-binding-like beta-propeller repeat protein [Candidatus Sumerlaeota bacterium]
MKNAKSRWIVVSSILILWAVSSLPAADWPQWRGSNRDGKVSDFKAPQTWPKELTAKWRVPVGAADATPALVGDKLYVFARQGEEEVTRCLNATDGKEVWIEKYATGAATGAAGRHPGPRSSLAVSDGKIVTLGVCGVLSCLDASNGKMLWRKTEFTKTVLRFFTSMSPLIVDGLVIAHLGKEGQGALIAFELASGDVKWKWEAEGPGYASPVLMTVDGVKQIVTLTEKSVAGVALADGKLLWQIPFPPQERAYNTATPIVEGQTVIYTGQNRGTHAVKIEKQGDTFTAKPVWDNAEVAIQYNSPVLKDGFLYGLSDKGFFFCLNAQTGKTAWITDKKESGFGEIVDAGSCLLALPEQSGLIAFKATDKQYEELARLKVSDTAIYAYPVVSGNRVFVKDQDSVALFVIE